MRNWRRRTRFAVGALVVLLGLPLLLLLLLLAPVRTGLLGWGVGRTASSLPGQIRWERLDWSSPGRIELENVLWSVSGDTLLALEEGTLAWRYRDLLRKQVDVSEITLSGLVADIPAIQAALPTPVDSPSSAESTSPPSFPRVGSLPPLPAVSVERMQLTRIRMQLEAGRTLLLDSVEAGVELRPDREATLRLVGRGLRDVPETFAVNELELNLDPHALTAAGGFDVELPGRRSYTLQLIPEASSMTTLAIQGFEAELQTLNVSGRLAVVRTPHWLVDLQVQGDIPGGRIDSSRLGVEAPNGLDGALQIGLQVALPELEALAAFNILNGDSLVVELAPLILQTPQPLHAWPPGEPQHTLIFKSVPHQRLRVHEWPIQGDLGQWLVGAELDAVQGSRVALSGIWNEIPSLLLDRLGLDPATVDRLRQKWPLQPAPNLQIVAEWPPDGETLAPHAISATAQWHLPGPRLLEPLWLKDGAEAPFDLDPWDDLRGRLTAELDLDGPEPTGMARLDLTETSWLDRAQVSARLIPGGAELDSMNVEISGLSIQASGRFEAERIDLRGAVRMSDTTLLDRVPGLADRDLRGSAEVDWRLTGEAARPQLEAELAARLGLDTVEVPELRAQLRANADTVDVRLELDQLLQVGLRVALPDPQALAAVDAQSDGGLVVELSPLILRTPQSESVWSLGEPRHPLVFTSEPHQRLRIDEWPILGDLGQWLIRAELDATEGSRIALTGVWDEVPPLLLDRLDLDPATIDQLRQKWPTEPAPDLQIAAEWPPDGVTLAPQAISATAQWRLPGPQLLEPLWLKDGVEAPFDLDGWSDLNGRATVDLNLEGPEPTGTVRLEMAETSWLDQARATARLIAGGAALDSLDVKLPGLSIQASGRIEAESIDLHGAVRLPDAALMSRVPSLAARDPRGSADVDWRLTGDSSKPQLEAELAARLGLDTVDMPELRAQLRANADTVDFQLELDRLLQIAGAASLTPTGISARLDTFAFAVAKRELRNRTPVRLTFAADDTTWALSDLDLAGTMGTVHGGAFFGPDSLATQLDLDLMLPRRAVAEWLPDAPPLLHQQGDIELKTKLAADVTRDHPHFDWQGGVLLTGDAVASRFELRARAGLNAAAEVVQFDLNLEQGDSTLVRSTARIPVEIVVRPPAIRLALEDSAGLDLHSLIPDLTVLNDVLPAGVTLAGRTRLDLSAAGADTLYDLEGDFEGTDLRVDLGEGSWVQLEGGLKVAGTTAQPRLNGGLTIEAGVVQLPEVPPVLLPTRGESLLWNEYRSEADTVSGAKPVVPAAKASPVSVDVDLEFLLNVPGNLWLRGQGMEVELEGDLTARWRDGQPVVVGRLGAARGSFRFLGRVFEIERGTANFLGDLDADPIIDFALTSDVGGTVFNIALTGPALKPELTLTSDPELSQGDIMATLLFGKPLDDLNEGQEALLRQRAGQVLLAYGAVQLQDQLSRRLGVDLVTINQSVEDEQASSLVLGKYLSPRVLLSYEQFLDAESAFRVRLEYALSRAFDIETTVGQGEESGVELKWSRDY